MLLKTCSSGHGKRQVVRIQKKKAGPEKGRLFYAITLGLKLQCSRRDELIDSVVGFKVNSADIQRLPEGRK